MGIFISLLKGKFKDDYDLNFQLRKKFRAEKKVIEQKEQIKNEAKNFALPLAEASRSDLVCAYISYGFS